MKINLTDVQQANTYVDTTGARTPLGQRGKADITHRRLGEIMSSVHIEVSPNGREGKVIIDGHDIAKSVTGFTVRSQVGHPPQLELDLRAYDVTTFAAPHVQVLIDSTTAEYLERAGWTPPPGEHSILTRDADGCPCERHTWWEMPDGVMAREGDEGAQKKTILGRTVPTCPVHGVNTRAD